MKKYSLLFTIILNTTISFSQEGSAHTTKLFGEQVQLFNEISSELICQCGCNLVLGSCGHVNCPSAVPMREMIESMILAQKPKTEIIAYFVNDYTYQGKKIGKKILSQPATSGFDLIAWTLPYIVFGIFVIFVIFIVRKHSHSASREEKSSPTNSTNTLSSEETKKIEEELKKLE